LQIAAAAASTRNRFHRRARPPEGLQMSRATTNRKTWVGGGTLAAALAAAGCSSASKIPEQEVANVEVAIRAAENATATQHAKALLDRARAALSSAQSERAKGNDGAARARLEEARSAASAAESQARSVQAVEEQTALQHALDDYDRRIREFNAQRPQERP
jgi:hypothetical protein